MFVTLYTLIFLSYYKDTRFENLGELSITGKIISTNEISSDFTYLTLTNVNIIDSNQNTYFLNANLSVKLDTSNSNFDLKNFYAIAFVSNISSIDLFSENYINTFYLKNNIRYVTENVVLDNVIILGESSNFIEKVKEHNRKLLVEVFGDTNGNLAYASLYGDKSYTDSELLDQFRQSGVAHIFTVSGLHISLIVLVISFFISKTNASNLKKFIINLLILFVFCLLCNFSSSVIRASIMALVMISSKIFGKKYDVLNSVSLAGCILLILNPLNTFDIGFQMTFASVIGIIMFGSLFNKIKIQNKYIKTVYSALTTSLGAQLGLFPIFANSYGYITTWSVLANIIIVPIFSVFFSIFFVINFIVLILPFLKFLYFLPNIILSFVIKLNAFSIMLPYGMVSVNALSFELSCLFYIAMYVLSKFIVMDFKYKVIISIIIYSLISYNIISNSKFRSSYENKITFYSVSSSIGTLLETKNNKFYLINPDLTKSNSIANSLYDLKINNLSGIITLQDDLSINTYTIYQNLKEFTPTIYLSMDNVFSYDFESQGFNVVEVSKTYDESSYVIVDDYFKLEYFYFDYDHDLIEEVSAISIEIEGYNIKFFDGNLPINNETKNYLSANFSSKIDLLRVIGCREHILISNLDYVNLVYDRDYITSINLIEV